MIYIINKNTDPAYNHALEEYMMMETDDDVFTLWQNETTVLLGKNQYAPAEVDLEYTKEHGIKVVRRLSGGGTVFCDMNNMQYTFITSKTDMKGPDSFKIFAKPVVEALKSLGLNAEFTGRNDILIDGKKVSGNAQYRKKDRIIHHGTLLFGVDKEALSGSLRSRPIKFKNKGVKSVASRIGTIGECLPDMSVKTFFDYLTQYIIDFYKINEVYEYDDKLKEKTEKYVKRFKDDAWNLGKDYKNFVTYADKYSFGLIEYMLNVKDGIIDGFDILGDYFEVNDISGLTDRFIGKKLEKDEIEEVLKDLSVADYIKDMDNETLINDLLKIKEEGL